MSTQISNTLSLSETAQVNTTYDEDYIVRGQCFSVNKNVTIADNTKYYILIDPRPTKPLSRMVIVKPTTFSSSAGIVTVNIYAGSNYTGGTSITGLNRNGESTITPATLLKENVTGNSLGILKEQYLVGGTSTNQNKGGGSQKSNYSQWLNRSTTYLYEVFNQSGGSITFNIEGVFFEVGGDLD